MTCLTDNSVKSLIFDETHKCSLALWRGEDGHISGGAHRDDLIDSHARTEHVFDLDKLLERGLVRLELLGLVLGDHFGHVERLALAHLEQGAQTDGLLSDELVDLLVDGHLALHGGLLQFHELQLGLGLFSLLLDELLLLFPNLALLLDLLLLGSNNLSLQSLGFLDLLGLFFCLLLLGFLRCFPVST